MQPYYRKNNHDWSHSHIHTSKAATILCSPLYNIKLAALHMLQPSSLDGSTTHNLQTKGDKTTSYNRKQQMVALTATVWQSTPIYPSIHPPAYPPIPHHIHAMLLILLMQVANQLSRRRCQMQMLLALAHKQSIWRQSSSLS
jgi:hypothetical protein